MRFILRPETQHANIHVSRNDSYGLAILRLKFMDAERHRLLGPRVATPLRLGMFAARQDISLDTIDWGAHSQRWRALFTQGYEIATRLDAKSTGSDIDISR